MLEKVFEHISQEFHCKKCNKNFASAESLAQHSKLHKRHQSVFKCTDCSLDCATPYILIAHLLHQHGKEIDIETAKNREREVVQLTKGKNNELFLVNILY